METSRRFRSTRLQPETPYSGNIFVGTLYHHKRVLKSLFPFLLLNRGEMEKCDASMFVFF